MTLSKVYPQLCKWHYFVPFYGWVIFHCIYVPHLLYPAHPNNFGLGHTTCSVPTSDCVFSYVSCFSQWGFTEMTQADCIRKTLVPLDLLSCVSFITMRRTCSAQPACLRRRMRDPWSRAPLKRGSLSEQNPHKINAYKFLKIETNISKMQSMNMYL